jgi:tetratricopeptide (TPR) repeat protein
VPTPPPKVFISSTWLDLQAERAAVEQAIRRMREPGFNGMEYFGSRDDTPREVSLAEVDRSDIYVGIFAARYGSGITEAEYRRARERGLPCFIYFKADSSITLDKAETKPKARAQLKKLKAELQRTHVVTTFSTSDELAAKVTADLHRWLTEEYQPRETTTTPLDTVAALALAALHQLPPPPRDFTGRTAELAELMSKIDEGGVTISGLQGQGGIGKTALALKLAAQLTPRYPDAQFYLDLKGHDTSKQPLNASDALAHVIRAYYPTVKLPDNEADLRALYQSVLHDQCALLLMDNARNAEQVAPLIPPGSCVLLVTSRNHFKLPGQFLKNIDKLSPDEARALLLTIEPRIGDQADAIARLCGHLPLALRLAASALAERADLSPADYARRLTDTQQRLKLLDEVETSLSLSYDLLSAELQQRWRTLAVFPATFDAAAAAAVWQMDSDAAQDTLGELIKYSMLEWDDAIARYGLHDLARLFADERLSADERDTSQARHAAHYLDVIEKADDLYLEGGEAFMRGLALFDAEWTNIQAGQLWAARHADDNDAAARLCARYPNDGSSLLGLRQPPHERIGWLEKALSAAQKLKDRTIEATSLNNLGLAYTDLNEPRRAIEIFEQALVIDRETGNRQGEGSVLNNLGNAYAELGELRRAMEFYEQDLAIAQEIGDRRGEGSTLSNLGLAYYELGEPQRAIEFYEQALIIRRETGDLRGEGIGLWNMSLALDELGSREQAIAYAEASLKIREQIDDPLAARVREQLAEWRGEAK